eukprot:g3995.t1
MAHPTGKASPPPLSSHMIKHHLRHRSITTHVEGGERDRELRLAGALETENGDVLRGLSSAAANGDLDTLKRTLPYIRHVTKDHYLELLNEPLSASCAANHRSCVEVLLEWGADPMRHFNGEPAVVVAAAHGNSEALEAIVERDTDINCRNHTGYSPLMKACANGHAQVAEFLINLGVDRDIGTIPGGLTALMIVANKGNLGLTRLLLDGNMSTGETGCDREKHENHLGFTAMIFAARKGYVDIVEAISSFGGNVHARDKSGMTAMHHAAHFNKLKTFRFLWGFEGCINDRDDKGRTPLVIAVQRGMRGIVELAVGIDRGVRGNYQGAEGRKRGVGQEGGKMMEHKEGGKSAEGKELMDDEEEEQEEDPDVVRWARQLVGTADVEAKDNLGRTALIWAVLNCRYVLVRLLMVDGGASLEPTDIEGLTALDHARELKLPDMISVLEQSAKDRAKRLIDLDRARKLAEKQARKAARRAELSDSEFDFTSSDDDDDEEED